MENFYNIKINYEIAYRVSHQEGGRIVVIMMAGTRKNFYEALTFIYFGRHTFFSGNRDILYVTFLPLFFL
ncbi:MAG TPA: hypothetical protein DDW65_12100 [Firmicutes bacterium]|jgi:hypothetical protein|nr:hypothetical protein [Bacillota bacterium]